MTSLGSRWWSGRFVGWCVVVCAAAPAVAQPNDNCATPTGISGNGVFAFNLTSATTGVEGQGAPNCLSAGSTGIDHDVWYCWTANCTGMVQISTCGLTTVDTKLAFYAGGCACPTPPPNTPLCCNDDSPTPPCGLQAQINCEVTCGQQYLIQLGVKPGSLPGSGSFSINCNGTPCDCDDCCGGRPQFLASAGFTGGVGIMTQEFGQGTRVVTMIDISGQPAPGGGTNWAAATHYVPSGAQNWTRAWLGTVYGVAMDAPGNVYVAHTPVYTLGGDMIGTIPGGAAGAIYKIDTASGVPSTFAVLPNSLITGCAGTDCWPGLGDLAYSCPHRMLYASNFEDGRIYAINGVGTVLYTWKHATGISGAGGAPDIFDTNGFAPLGPHGTTGRGQRVWGLGVSRGRLYYSVWREDVNRPDATQANEVWSVGLVGSGPNLGQPIAGSEQLEITLPAFAANYSNPVAGISFRPNTCCMLLAERTMSSDTASGAHQSRLLEYCPAGGGWAPSGVNFTTGDLDAFLPQSSAGGCDYDFQTVGTTVNVWSTADALKLTSIPLPYEAIYGLGGIPFAGGNPKAGGLMIDSDQSTAMDAKLQQGDVQITCPQSLPPPCEPAPDGLTCINPCPQPGLPCVPTEITLGLDGVYRVTKCDCTDFCHVDFGPAEPVCVSTCPSPPPNQMCMMTAKGNMDGSISFKCICTSSVATGCVLGSECDPDHPGQCIPACVGKCPPGFACIPIELVENPAGSGNFQVSDCDCLPILNPPCHPVVINGAVQCIGTCPAPSGAKCRIVATPDPPPPPPLVGAVRYRCECDCEHPPKNMVDWWPMDDNPVVFPINDIAGVLNHGTPLGGVTPANPPLSCVGGGLFFNGTTGYVTVPNVPGPLDINFGLGNFTLEGWIQCDFPQINFHPILDKRVQLGANIFGYHMFILNNKLGFQMGAGTGLNYVASLLPNVTDGLCHHVAAVVRRGAPNTIRLFVDGVSQTFSDGQTGSVSNTVDLRFGRRWPIAAGDAFFSGGLDEWEFFRRALADQEIIDLYAAKTIGKCREVCYTPRVTFCKNHTSRSFCFQICNYTATAYTYNWGLSGPIGGSGCNNVGSITFTPSGGSVLVLPGQCQTVCVSMSRPTGLPNPPPYLMGCYQLTVVNTTTGNTFGCSNKIMATPFWCPVCVPAWNIANVRVGATRNFAWTVTNEGDPTGQLSYSIRAAYAEDGSPDSQVVSLNGLPPGEPVIGTLALAMGGTAQIPISVNVLEQEPFTPIEILLQADADGDGLPDPADPIAIRTVHGCQDDIPGDVNEDGTADLADVDPFAAALLGRPIDPYHAVLADVDCDGKPDSLDIQPFVEAVTPP